MHGRIQSVRADYRGDTLSAAVSISDTVLHVYDVADFDEDGGWLKLTPASTAVAYSTCDDDLDTVTLVTGSPIAVASGEPLRVWDADSLFVPVEFVAQVATDDDGMVEAVIDHALVPLAGVGIAQFVGKSAELEYDDDTDLRVVSILGTEPVADGAFIGDGTIVADKIAAGAITAGKIAAGAIDGQTITGALIRSAASGARFELSSGVSSNLFYAYSGLASEVSPGRIQTQGSTSAGIDTGDITIQAPLFGIWGTAHPRTMVILSANNDTPVAASSMSVLSNTVIFSNGENGTGTPVAFTIHGNLTVDSAVTMSKKIQAGVETTGAFSAVQVVNSVTVTFAVAFAAAPSVTVTPSNVTNPDNAKAVVSGISTTGFIIQAMRPTGSSTTAFNVAWIATATTQ